MNLTISNLDGKERGEIAVSEKLFDRRYNAALLHHAVRATFSNGRVGSRRQKTRAEVAGTRSKMYRQKGTGRARAGHRSSPIRRSGGRAFPSSPDENFSKKINRREFTATMAVVLSQLVREKRLFVVRSLAMATNKTRDFLPMLSALNIGGKVLMVDSAQPDANLTLASRNVPDVDLLLLSFLLPTDLINADYVVFSQGALERCAEMWGSK